MRSLNILLLIVFSITTFAQQKKEYICPPCSFDCHNLVFDGPGQCTVCSMELLNKANINEGLSYTHIYLEDVCDIVEQNPNVLLLDVRTVGEFSGETSDLGYLTNAINIPIQELEDRMMELDNFKEDEIIVYCSISMRSPRASKSLAENGFTNIKNMLGGMTTWNSASTEKLPCKMSLLGKN